MDTSRSDAPQALAAAGVDGADGEPSPPGEAFPEGDVDVPADGAPLDAAGSAGGRDGEEPDPAPSSPG
ncbi:hypothetical protein [Streptomyces sp. 142MFCol3.1]|uniref:hypothetical protein n=1 Tax=Streptomyces sp. 142MFCol3.1 TaxID=1172179 RepID=UPI000426A21E|nr:hypothetical protein [Streptomyces sp. 142MFCol3.1]